MAGLVSLDNTAHRDIRIHSGRVEAAGATLNMVPVIPENADNAIAIAGAERK